ncbi:hypothetical protein SAMN04488034_101320 [Salinimicrobium catena]|uniref:DUF1508 domain-containing protein n=1 Tax=Salinimicrobium catena TaxID=390640 RepID=A0A1H5I3T8_9FLAO|nr:hypothetical protein [Salinimicrobium catena]SDK74737.1 hypothetical protein SAMN04488140_101320 [Salinimicrobium catena]SEE34872.1 hypothetical protein SAMN04488034_101320 [Salinimicrobium catena]
MKNNIRILFTVVLFSFVCTTATAQRRAKKKADEDTHEWRYEIECVGTGTEGNYLLKVWSFSKRPHVAAEQAKKNAVHGVIFKGVPAGDRGCVSQPALARNANLEEEKAAFFENFFMEGGKYQKFVNLTTNGAIAQGDRMKIGRREYKIGVIVSVNKALLRRDLEDAGIVRGLSSGF